jgi:DNA modification methylase
MPRADISLKAYQQFLDDKATLPPEYGVPIEPSDINAWFKPHQRVAIEWMVRGGRRALFASFGLGKTGIQLETLRLILRAKGGWGLIVAPLGVRQEFKRDAETLGIDLRVVRSNDELEDGHIHITNYETVRDGKLNPAGATVATLDEGAILRGFGGTKTFREFMKLFAPVPYRFVATATPDPNDYIELLAYADFLGVLDVSQGKTRFFKRDSTKADKLTVHPHKEQEWWMFVSSWALFLSKPSDLGPGYSDEGYDLPPLKVIPHELQVEHGEAQPDRKGQGRMFRDATGGVVDAAREKRDTLKIRIAEAKRIIDSQPGEHFLLWHDLENERHEIERTIPNAVTVYGEQRGRDLEALERAVIGFADGDISILGAKPSMFGTGANWQRHCARAIFCGIGFQFAAFIQAIHRIYRFLQTREVEIHLIYAESERPILAALMEKWDKYKAQLATMTDIIREHGLSRAAMSSALKRQTGVARRIEKGRDWQLVNADSVIEMHAETAKIEPNSVHLILTSIPFANQYEYSPNFADFGCSDSNEHFFDQMEFLLPHLLRALAPGRLFACHVKDRIVPGGITGLGFQTVYPLHCECIRNFTRHGFAYMGMKTIVTDVVRENSQTYRLGWTEQCKDGTKMGVGMPEYLLIFRKPPTDTTNSYADTPVVKLKRKYSRSRWQIDAHGFTRSSGDRLLSPADLDGLPHSTIFKLYREFSLNGVYDFENHVALEEALEAKEILPVTFMLLQPQSWHPDVWTDITRMRTLNTFQAAKGREGHLCPMQLDIADRAIAQWTREGETVLDPFSGLGTVPSRAVRLKRRAIGIELSTAYHMDAITYLTAAEREVSMPTLFDLEKAEEECPTEEAASSMNS